jgi:prevent-host-death family protein
MDIFVSSRERIAMKIISARDAKNRFGEFLDAARREPVVVTRNDRPVCIMISIEDAADTLLPEFLLDREAGYDGWLFDKVTTTMRRLDQGETAVREHGEAMDQLRERLQARVPRKTA